MHKNNLFILILGLILLTSCVANKKESLEDYKTFAEKMKTTQLDYKATYTMHFDNGITPTTDTITRYIKGKNFRADSEDEIAGKKQDYFINNHYISCNTPEGTWQCKQFKDTPTPLVDITNTRIFDTSVDISTDGTITLAGTTGTCYKTLIRNNGPLGDTHVRMCYTTKGILLYQQIITEENTLEIQTTTITEGISDNEFIPPATPELSNY